MSYTPGQTYYGLTDAQWQALENLGNTAISDFLNTAGYWTNTTDGTNYHILTAPQDVVNDFMTTLEENDVAFEESVSLFIYMSSTWQIAGF